MNPYLSLPPDRYWRTGVQQSDPAQMPGIHTPKFSLDRTDTIVTMGSCFAQHIANWLRDRGFDVPYYDATDNIRSKTFSANYGNIYTVRQALQLLQEIAGQRVPSERVWPAEGGFADPLRPAQFLTPFASPEAVLEARRQHLEAVRRAVQSLDVLVFTLGLTEAWRIRACGTILPTAPGVVAGAYDPESYDFVNFRYGEVLADLEALCREIRALRGGREFRLLLTVSPVPLTATASGEHVLRASTYSKSVLRAVAGDFSADHAFADYFPSFELVSNPAARSAHFEENLRSVRPDAVARVMTTFERLCLVAPEGSDATSAGVGDVECEDALLDAFAGDEHPEPSAGVAPVLVVGNSHLSAARKWLQRHPLNQPLRFAPINFMTENPFRLMRQNRFRRFEFREGGHSVADFDCNDARVLVLVGCGFAGDAIVRAHGKLTAVQEGEGPGEFSPRLPIVRAVTDDLVAFYRPAAEDIVKQARNLDAICDFDRIFWIASPDMTERAARVRFGDDFVDSGAYKVHRSAYDAAFRAALGSGAGSVRFITHPPQNLSPQSGFAADRFFQSDIPWDIHCAPRFFRAALDQVRQALVPQDAASAGSGA